MTIALPFQSDNEYKVAPVLPQVAAPYEFMCEPDDPRTVGPDRCNSFSALFLYIYILLLKCFF
jgi:hypothetical protein